MSSPCSRTEIDSATVATEVAAASIMAFAQRDQASVLLRTVPARHELSNSVLTIGCG